MASSQIRLRLLPGVRCLFDKVTQIRVEGLAPRKRVELRSRLVDDRGVTFKASALYESDEAGTVDLCHATSTGGSYTGVEPMGLFWAMRAETPHSKLIKRSVTSPTRVRIEVLNGETGETLASETNERGYMTEGMERIEVREGRIRGILFVPPGEGPFPAIIDLSTLAGGLSEPRASLLANKGFVVFALAFYAYQDLPKHLDNMDLEYFEEAVEYLLKRPEVKGPGVGIVSISYGTVLALSMSSFLSGISATACINACNANVLIPLRYKDIVIPPLPVIMENIRTTASGLFDLRDGLADPSLGGNRASLIPIERAQCRFLFAVSEDDRNWDSPLFARQAAETLRRHGKGDRVEVVTYPRAGHFLEPPNTPHHPSSVHAAVRSPVVFGGEPKAHAEAQLDLWKRLGVFFRRYLDSKST